MSAVVCGKRSVFDDIHGSPPVQKRHRCGGGGSSPARYSPWRSGSPTSSPSHTSAADIAELVLQIKALFPDMGEQLIVKVLESTGNSLDSAIKSLTALRLSSDGTDVSQQSFSGPTTVNDQMSFTPQGDSAGPERCRKENDEERVDLPSEGGKWVELFVQEMLNAANLEDARNRATRALEAFEKMVMARSGSTCEDLQKENVLLKGQLEGLLRDNHVLKRAVSIQHERQVEHENCAREMQHLKQLIAQYQEQVWTLELSNCALNLHLQRAQEGTSMPGRFHPDVF